MECLLLRLLSDIYGAIDKSQLTLLALFDVSAAFDSVDHDLCSNACLYLLESVVSRLLGSPLIFQFVLPVFSSVLLAHLGVLLRLVWRRVRFWVLFYTSSLPLKLVLSLPPALF